MPIAIYRHMKLSVAMPRYANPEVLNFSPRILRQVFGIKMDDGSDLIGVAFTRIERRKLLRVNHNETWEFHNGQFNVIHQVERGGYPKRLSSSAVPPLGSNVWTQDGRVHRVYHQFEDGMSSRCAIEHYLYTHVSNPQEYHIVTINFNPKKRLENGGNEHLVHAVRDWDEVESSILSDRSESAEEWLKLFESA